jgi:hypothetical protein
MMFIVYSSDKNGKTSYRFVECTIREVQLIATCFETNASCHKIIAFTQV